MHEQPMCVDLGESTTLHELKLRRQGPEAWENRVSGRAGDLRNNLVFGKPSERRGADFNHGQKLARNSHASAEQSADTASLANVQRCQLKQLDRMPDSCAQLASARAKRPSDDQTNAAANRNNMAILRDDAASPTRPDPKSKLRFNFGQPSHISAECAQPRKGGQYHGTNNQRGKPSAPVTNSLQQTEKVESTDRVDVGDTEDAAAFCVANACVSSRGLAGSASPKNRFVTKNRFWKTEWPVLHHLKIDFVLKIDFR